MSVLSAVMDKYLLVEERKYDYVPLGYRLIIATIYERTRDDVWDLMRKGHQFSSIEEFQDLIDINWDIVWNSMPESHRDTLLSFYKGKGNKSFFFAKDHQLPALFVPFLIKRNQCY